MSTTVRLSTETRERLARLAAADGETLTAALERLVHEEEIRRFAEEFNAAYERIWADPQLAAIEREERALWDNAMRDGLHDEPPYVEGDGVGE